MIGKQPYILLVLESALLVDKNKKTAAASFSTKEKTTDKSKKAVDIQPEEAVSSVGEKKISKPRKPRAKKGIIIFLKQ